MSYIINNNNFPQTDPKTPYKSLLHNDVYLIVNKVNFIKSYNLI